MEYVLEEGLSSKASWRRTAAGGGMSRKARGKARRFSWRCPSPNTPCIFLNSILYRVLWQCMAINQMKKIEKIAEDSAKYARKSLAKSDELYALLSLVEAKAGKMNRYASVNDIFRKLKIS